MGIFDRMGRVISSRFNALLDGAEDPKKSLELTLAEMKEQLKAARQEVVRGVAAEKQLKNKVADLDAEVEVWARRAELAVKHGDDELAREALVQKKRLTAERDRAEALRGEQRSAALEMKAELERMEQKLEELKARQGQLVAKAQQVKSAAAGVPVGVRSGGRAFEEFRRMEDQIEGVEEALAAAREIDAELGLGRGPSGMTTEEVEAKFRQLEYGSPKDSAAKRSEVDDELAQLKRKVRVDA